MKKNEGPCRSDCPDRCIAPNCHMTCQVYIDYVAAERERREAIRKARAGEYDARGYLVYKAYKNRRRNNG